MEVTEAPEIPSSDASELEVVDLSTEITKEPYLPECSWVTLDSRRSQQCSDTDSPEVFRLGDSTESFERYRWQFSEPVTIAELGFGHSAEQQDGSDHQGRRRVQQAGLQRELKDMRVSHAEKVLELKDEIRELRACCSSRGNQSANDLSGRVVTMQLELGV